MAREHTLYAQNLLVHSLGEILQVLPTTPAQAMIQKNRKLIFGILNKKIEIYHFEKK